MSFEERFTSHEAFLKEVLGMLDSLGYQTEVLNPDGYLPDARVWMPFKGGEKAFFIDTKTRGASQQNFSIEMQALHEYGLLPDPVFIVWGDWKVDTPETLYGRLGDVKAPTGKGSTTWWHLVPPGGADFVSVFPQREQVAA